MGRQSVDYAVAVQPAPRVAEPAVKYLTKSMRRAAHPNYFEIEQRNKALGEQGEAWALDYEKWRLKSAGLGKWVNQVTWKSKEEGDGLGYDILSCNADGSERYIEVKTTKGRAEVPIFFSKNELLFSQDLTSAWNVA